MNVEDDPLLIDYHSLAYGCYTRAIGEMILRIDLER
jgi:hypothetical protein